MNENETSKPIIPDTAMADTFEAIGPEHFSDLEFQLLVDVFAQLSKWDRLHKMTTSGNELPPNATKLEPGTNGVPCQESVK